MAIDSSIYANQRQMPSFADAMAPYIKIQEARNNMALQQQQLQNMQAQNPGIVAQSRDAVRTAARNQDVQDITAKYKSLDADGNATFDAKGASTALAGAGYWQEASLIEKDNLDHRKQELDNQLAAETNPIKVAAAKKAHADEVIKGIANIADQIKDPVQRTEFLKNAIPYAVTSQQVNPDDPRFAALQKGNTRPVANVAATPQERDHLAVAQASLGLAEREQKKQFATSFFTPEGQDPNSPLSKQVRDYALANGIPVTATMSAYDITQRYPGTAQAVSNAVTGAQMPTSVRAGGVEKGAALGATIDSYDKAISSLTGVKKDLGPTKLGTIGGSVFNKLIAQNPSLAGIDTAIQVHNRNFPDDPINTETQTIDQIRSKLKAGKAQLQSQKTGAEAVATATRLPGSPVASTPAPTVAAKVAPEKAPANTVKMFKDGNFSYVPISKIDTARKAGWTIK